MQPDLVTFDSPAARDAADPLIFLIDGSGFGAVALLAFLALTLYAITQEARK